MYKKVENNPGYIRDTYSKAILNVDDSALEAYKRQSEYAKSQQDAVHTLSHDINNIKQEMQDIKSKNVNQ